MNSILRWYLPGLLLCLALAVPAEATTYVMMTDQALTDQAPLVVEGRVVAKGRDDRAPSAVTVYTVEVSRALKGAAADDTVAVRVPGGSPSETEPWRHAWGVPRFRLGEEVLLFLAPGRDGGFGLSQLALGAFRTVTVEGRRLALRPELVDHAVGGEERLRDLGAFTTWLADRARERAGSRGARTWTVWRATGRTCAVRVRGWVDRS